MANNLFNPDHALESQIRDFSIIPLSMGRFLIASDSKSIFYDLENSRIQLTDIITLNTETERASILAPLDKFYFVKGSSTLWRYVNDKWKSWPSSGSGGTVSRAVDAVLTVAGWVNNEQVVNIVGLTANQNGVAGLAQSVSALELEAAGNASMYVCGQTDGSITIALGGDKPTCDIPITIILLN